MIPPQFQGWLLLHRARLRDQDNVGVMTVTGGSLNVEKSLLDLFTDDVLQSVTMELLENSTLVRQLKRFQKTMMKPISTTTTVKMMIRTSMKTETFLRLKWLCLMLTTTLAIDHEEYQEALLGYGEARDLMKEARVVRGFCRVVVPIRSDMPTGGKGDSSCGKNVLSGKTGRGKGGRGSKDSGRSFDTRGRIKKGKGSGRSGPAGDGPSNSQVCFKCGSTDHWARDCS